MVVPEPLYQQIWPIMPIACVDVVAHDGDGRVLLLCRAEEPAKGQWWFPGGRVHHMETRADAAARKLKEECSLAAIAVE